MIDETTVTRLLAILPDLAPVTLYTRVGPGDDFAAGVAWTAQRLPRVRESEDAGGEGGLTTHSADFRLLYEGQALTPTRGDKLAEADGTEWAVLDVDVKLLRTVYNLACSRNR